MTVKAAWPPVSENDSPDDKKARRKAETDAKKISEGIDKEIEQDRVKRKKRNGAKILLLGQAESGKSTVLKNFQLYFAPKAFDKEAELWRPVIHLNLVRSINFVVAFVTSARSLAALEDGAGRPSNVSQLVPEVRALCQRLDQLRQVEQDLISLLSGRLMPSKPPKRGLLTNDDESVVSSTPDIQKESQRLPQEVAFPSNGGWKLNFASITAQKTWEESSNNASRTLATLKDDVAALWDDQCIQNLLRLAGIRLDEQPGFFLDGIRRITDESYVPEAGDILKARVTTYGVEEHMIVVEGGPDCAREWTIYDVGGSRTQRTVWAQFFDDVNAIIFMAPMSGFNQVLAEDESVNRLGDSLRLWQTICSNALLADVEFILFLNKLDILEAKLSAGIQFSSFIPSYTGKNEPKPVSAYLLDVFTSLHQQNSPKKRKLHSHLTCCVNKKATRSIISRIRETVLVKLLRDTSIM